MRQEYNFSPPGTTLEHEEWSIKADAVSQFMRCLLELERRLNSPDWKSGDAAAAYSGAFTEFRDELVRIVRADSRLLQHPVVALWVKNAQRFGWRAFLAELPGDLEKGVKRPFSATDEVLFAEIDRLQWGEEQDLVAEPLVPEGVSLDQQLKALRERRRSQVPPEIRLTIPTEAAMAAGASPRPLGISLTRPPVPRRSLAAIQRRLGAGLTPQMPEPLQHQVREELDRIRDLTPEGFRQRVKDLQTSPDPKHLSAYLTPAERDQVLAALRNLQASPDLS